MHRRRATRSADPPPGAGLSEGAHCAHILRREGDYWTIVYAGITVRPRDAIGVHYLALLLAHPHERFSVEQLLAAVKGIGAVHDERARSAVGKRIRDAMRRIQEYHAALGYHLSAGIKTGAHCVYRPDPERPLPWIT